MKKSKLLNILAIIMLVASVGMILYRLIESIVYDVNGWHLAIPGPSLNKWYEIFCFNVSWDIVWVGPVFIVGILLLVFAKCKKEK